MPAKPMLDDVELQHVQKVEAGDKQVLAQHGVPALDGDFLQDLERRVTRLTLNGVMIGTEAGEQLKTLRLKFRNAEPVSFVSDIATATTVDKVLIEEFGVRELAGKPARFEYQLTLSEFQAAPKPEEEEPPAPPPPPPPPPSVETGALTVEVVVEGDPNFDFSKVTLTVEGTKADGSTLSQSELTNRVENVWTEEEWPPGQFTAKAVVTDPPPMSGTGSTVVRPGETAKVIITLRPGAIIAKAFVVHFRFDNSFVEPCMTEVLKQVAEHASANPQEKLLIVGHTDKTGSNEYNQSLSERRARSVFAYLTFGRDADASEAEWNELRQRNLGGLPQLKDTWGARQYQYILQFLGFYTGNVDGDHGPITDDAVKNYRESKGLPAGTTVDDQVWAALIHDYMAANSLTVSESQFLPNAGNGCDGGILKWLGCGEESPLPLPQPTTENPHRPYRRVEMLFVATDRLPCEVPQPDTFNLPAPGAVSPSWCLGPGDPSRHCCFATRDCATAQPGQWCIEPAETGTVIVRGSMKNPDGTPAAGVKYVLIAADGEFMDGEAIGGARRGDGNFGVTREDGTFEYPDNPKGPGIFTMEINGPFVARLADDPPGSGKGNVICARLEGTSTFDVVLEPAETADPRLRLRAMIHDRLGEPRKQTDVQVLFNDGTQGTSITNDKGEFIMRMNTPQEIGKIRYNISEEPGDVLLFADFFVDVRSIDTDEGLSRRLHNLGYLQGNDLAGAIAWFQTVQGLLPTGEADPETRAKLVSVHDGKDPIVPEIVFDDAPIGEEKLAGEGPTP